jgi:hypothetical protein
MKWKRSSPPALLLVGTMPLSADLELQATQLSNVPLPGEEPDAILGARSGTDTPICMTILLTTTH